MATRVQFTSVQGQLARTNAERTLVGFDKDLQPLIAASGITGAAAAVIDERAGAFWGNSSTSPAGTAVDGGRLLSEGDLFLTARDEAGIPSVTSVAYVIRHVLISPSRVNAVLDALPKPRWRGADDYVHDLVFLAAPLAITPIPVSDVNKNLTDNYTRTGIRYPSRIIDINSGEDAALITRLLGAGAAAPTRTSGAPVTTDSAVVSQLQAEADKIGVGATPSPGAFKRRLRNTRTRQRGASSEAFQIYGRTCAACGDTHAWRVEFAHLVPYGTATAERWCVGVPLCGNHHSDLDSGQLRLNSSLRWEAGGGASLNDLGVNAVSFGDHLMTSARPSKKIVKAHYIGTA